MSGLIKAACPSNITQLQINKVKVTWYPTNEEHWLQTNLSLTAFDFPSVYPCRLFQTTIHTGGTEASHQWTQEVFLRILHSFPQDHQLLKLSVFTYSYHILPLRKSLSRLSSVN